MNRDGQLLQRRRGSPVMLLPVSSSTFSQLSALHSVVAKDAGEGDGRINRWRRGGAEMQQEDAE